jgi:hypothetical protein
MEGVRTWWRWSMPDVRHYNVHDLIKFRIVRPRDWGLLRPVNLEFSFFETREHPDAPDIVLNISKFVPREVDCYLIDHKYRVRPDYFYCSDTSGRARWEMEIIGIEDGETTVNFWGQSRGKEALLYPDLLPQDLVLKPLLEYKLCRKNLQLVHAAAVCRDNEAYLLAGRGGAHKTTLAMQLVKRCGFSLMADDQTVIDDHTVLSFPKHIAQLCFKLEHMQTEEYSLVDKLRIIGYLRAGEFNRQIPYSAQLQAVVFVSRTNAGRIRIAEIPATVAVERLIVNNMMDMNSLGTMSGLFLRYMQAYSFAFPDSEVTRHWDRLRRGLRQTVSKVPLFEMQIPRDYTPDALEAFDCLVRDARRTGSR